MAADSFEINNEIFQNPLLKAGPGPRSDQFFGSVLSFTGFGRFILDHFGSFLLLSVLGSSRLSFFSFVRSHASLVRLFYALFVN